MSTLDKAIYDYHNCPEKSVREILEEYGLVKSTFYRHLDYKEESRENHRARKYTFNFDKFINDSVDKYYWLGFLGADGAVVNNSLSIELKSIDREHLEKFNSFFENTAPIVDRINNQNVECSKTSINSAELINYLAQYNIYQNKSKTYLIPIQKIPNEECALALVRGLLDGDGYVSLNNHQQITFGFCSGNENCVKQFKAILGIDNKISRSGNCYRIQVTGNIKAKSFLDKVYQGSTDANRLDRKYSIYKTLI